MIEDPCCFDKIHSRGLRGGQTYPQNTKKLSKKQKREITALLDAYRAEHGITTQSLVEFLLTVAVDMMADESYDSMAQTILPFANALTLIMNHAHSYWFDGDSWN